jgi:hypothetical protein
VSVDLVGSMARNHHDLVEPCVLGGGEGTLDEAETPELNQRLRPRLGAQS